MIYLCAGLYAEGPTDYRFFPPLIDRLLYEIAADLFEEQFEVAPTVGIDAPRNIEAGRENRVPAAIEEYWGQCTLFIIHTDGAGDPENARIHSIMPGLTKARQTFPDLAAAACVPIRETEAWMLADGEVFQKLLDTKKPPPLPHNPETIADPKAELMSLIKSMGLSPKKLDPYSFFGENVRTDALRRLPAFREFERDLQDAVRKVART